MEEILAVADLFLLTSEYESFGLAALEAMAAGVPVISTNAGGLPEIAIQGETGYLSNVGDIADMSDHAIEILSDNDVLKKFKRNGGRTGKKIRHPHHRTKIRGIVQSVSVLAAVLVVAAVIKQPALRRLIPGAITRARPAQSLPVQPCRGIDHPAFFIRQPEFELSDIRYAAQDLRSGHLFSFSDGNSGKITVRREIFSVTDHYRIDFPDAEYVLDNSFKNGLYR